MQECEINLKSYRNYLAGESPSSDNLYSLPHRAYGERNKTQSSDSAQNTDSSSKDGSSDQSGASNGSQEG